MISKILRHPEGVRLLEEVGFVDNSESVYSNRVGLSGLKVIRMEYEVARKRLSDDY